MDLITLGWRPLEHYRFSSWSFVIITTLVIVAHFFAIFAFYLEIGNSSIQTIVSLSIIAALVVSLGYATYLWANVVYYEHFFRRLILKSLTRPFPIEHGALTLDLQAGLDQLGYPAKALVAEEILPIGYVPKSMLPLADVISVDGKDLNLVVGKSEDTDGEPLTRVIMGPVSERNSASALCIAEMLVSVR
jgi:hypothetical protein